MLVEEIISTITTISILAIAGYAVDFILTKEQERIDRHEKAQRLYKDGRNIIGQFVKKPKKIIWIGDLRRGI